jgi:hypothetical protein
LCSREERGAKERALLFCCSGSDTWSVARHCVLPGSWRRRAPSRAESPDHTRG